MTRAFKRSLDGMSDESYAEWRAQCIAESRPLKEPSMTAPMSPDAPAKFCPWCRKALTDTAGTACDAYGEAIAALAHPVSASPAQGEPLTETSRLDGSTWHFADNVVTKIDYAKVMTLRLSEEMYDALYTIAQADRVPAVEVVRQAIANYLASKQ